MPKSNGGGVTLLVCVALAFTWPRVPRKGSAPLSAVHFHTLRTLGLKPAVPREVVPSLIDATADRHGIDRGIFRALVKVESGGNQRAVSHKGAIGLTQVMPVNARHCGLPSPKLLLDAVHSLNCGAKLLRVELDRYRGDQVKALQSYNGGPKCVGRCKESLAYSQKVLSAAKKSV